MFSNLFDFFLKYPKFENVQKIVEGLFIARFDSGLMRRDYCWDLSSNISKKVVGDETGFRRSNGHISLIYERISTGFGALRSERLGLTSRHVEIGVSDNRGSSSLVLCHLAGFRQPIDTDAYISA